MEQTSPEESPTRYMLPEQVDEGGSGLIDYSLNEYSPAHYPIATNKKKRKATLKKRVQQEEEEGKNS